MEKRSLNNSDISRLSGLSNSFVGNVLNLSGNISLKNAEKLANSLHVDMWVMILPPKKTAALLKSGKPPKLTADILKELVASSPPSNKTETV